MRPYHRDGLCPRCRKRKSGRRNGKRDAYCEQCRREYDRERKGCGRRVFTCGACVVCGENFVSANLNRIIGKYCSRRCEKAAQRRHKKFRGDTRTFIPVILADPCAYCGHPSAEVEHIVPLARGGANTWDNLTGACRSCNNRKSDKALLDYLLSV